MATVDKERLKNEIKQFIVETFLVGDEKDSLSDSDSFMAKGYIDSTGILELTQHVEESYNFTIEDEEMIPSNLDSINNLVEFISKKAG